MKTNRIGIIGAMDEEIALLVEQLTDRETIVAAGISFHLGRIFERDVVVCKCGVGKVNAAVCAQLLIEKFLIDEIIFTGVAGALDPELNIGDIVISEDCMQHDIDASALGFAKGTIPYQRESLFKADQSLVEKAKAAGQMVPGHKIVVGRILSGDQFIADRTKVEELHRSFNGTCTEMEGAAVAQVCVMNDIPFVIIRSMSDRADGSASVNFAEFTKLAAKQSLQIVEHILKS